MAEASGANVDGSSRAAHSSADSLTMVVVPPTLEDVVEEDDVFVSETTLKLQQCPANGTERLAPGREGPSPDIKADCSEFLHLTIRKQVSYR
ncbi:hypothetical protein E1301_Tti003416 [Triplophysa tibetana]|uniref:Uncharacterized protein n=1 Tax=Triplophysa tibetana TaxID=1572043 RepID=A0A5A9PR11_9TELE|nr:hypothetical protein E1301_Tti003416 [Triplophysa tibetana]